MHALLLAIILAAPASETTEAAKAAAWVKALPAPAADAAWFGALGATSTVLIESGTTTVRSIGPKAFYDNPTALAAALASVRARSTSLLPLLTAGGVPWFRDVQNVPWGMVEVAKGEFRWELIDALVAGSQGAGGRYVGTVMPYAGWEFVTAGVAPTTDPQCQTLLTQDFFYLAADRRMDRYHDLAEWTRFLTLAVERYDGDGVDDMPGLVTPIREWQIHNEPEGNHCGLFRDDVDAFVELMRVSSAAVHAACASCRVLNGGAAFPFVNEHHVPPLGGATFWSDYAAAGGAAYVDVIAVHYNQGKDPGHGSIDDFETQVHRIRELLGATKPVWVTEFGTLVGAGGGNLLGLPESEAAAWFLRFHTAGLAAGAERFFSDSSAFVTAPGNTIELPYYVNKLITARLGGFTAAERVAAGQYRFRVNGADVWVLWNGVPAALTGSVVATDLYGNDTITTAAKLTTSETSPLIVRAAASRRRIVGH